MLNIKVFNKTLIFFIFILLICLLIPANKIIVQAAGLDDDMEVEFRDYYNEDSILTGGNWCRKFTLKITFADSNQRKITWKIYGLDDVEIPVHEEIITQNIYERSPSFLINTGEYYKIYITNITSQSESVEIVSPKIDNTPPNVQDSQVTAGINFFEKTDVFFLDVKASDSDSGVKQVYFDKNDVLYELTPTANYYRLYLSESLVNNLHSDDILRVVVKDVAGNERKINISNKFRFLTHIDTRDYVLNAIDDLTKIKESFFTASAWESLLDAVDRFRINILSDNYIANAHSEYTLLLEAIAATPSVNFVISEVIENNNIRVIAQIQNITTSEVSQIKRGSNVVIYLKKVRQTAKTDPLKERVKLIADISPSDVTSFALEIFVDGAKYDLEKGRQDIQITISFVLERPPIVKLYRHLASENNDVFEEILLSDEIMKADGIAHFQGDFYIVTGGQSNLKPKGLTVGNRFYSLKTLLITSGIILAIIFLAIIIVVFLNKTVWREK